MTQRRTHLTSLALAALLAAAPALAGAAEGAGQGEQANQRDARAYVSFSGTFSARERAAFHAYLDDAHARGACPPGLVRQQAGCRPPVQARQWRLGMPLPRYADAHDLPSRLELEIGLPPRGHRYVRVADDILLIAIGSGLVVDALTDQSPI
jgi:Ni/Co efflux regulator RcnB